MIALLLDAEIESLSGCDPIPFCRIEIPDVIVSAGDREKIGISSTDQSVPARSTIQAVLAGASFEDVLPAISALGLAGTRRRGGAGGIGAC